MLYCLLPNLPFWRPLTARRHLKLKRTWYTATGAPVALGMTWFRSPVQISRRAMAVASSACTTRDRIRGTCSIMHHKFRLLFVIYLTAETGICVAQGRGEVAGTAETIVGEHDIAWDTFDRTAAAVFL